MLWRMTASQVAFYFQPTSLLANRGLCRNLPIYVVLQDRFEYGKYLPDAGEVAERLKALPC